MLGLQQLAGGFQSHYESHWWSPGWITRGSFEAFQRKPPALLGIWALRRRVAVRSGLRSWIRVRLVLVFYALWLQDAVSWRYFSYHYLYLPLPLFCLPLVSRLARDGE